MKLYRLLGLLVLLCQWGYAVASTGSQEFAADPDTGALFPSTINIITGEDGGSQYVSAVTTISESVLDDIIPERIDVASERFSWSYNRGVGTVPNACPAGFRDFLGGCWQDCPSGYSDMGAFCFNWSKFRSVSKQVIAASCPEGQVNEAGLCYNPCEAGFNGVGLLCIGNFGNALMRNQIAAQATKQQLAAMSTPSSGGIVLSEGNTPDIHTTVLFSTAMCGMETAVESVGLVSDPLGWVEDTVNEGVNSALAAANTSFTIPTGTAWFAPSIESAVLFDLSMDIACEDDGIISTALLNIDPSITVQLNTRMFDHVLSGLSGVDLGILDLSVYELIPFRVYGTVGSTVSTPLQLYAEQDRALPDLYVNNLQIATATSFSVTPALDLWLSANADLRVPSFLQFIPDILQLGTEFKLTVLEDELSYLKSSDLRLNSNGAYEMYNVETLANNFGSGSGYVDFYLRIFGQDVDIEGFNKDVDLSWVGYEQYDVLIDNASVVAL